VPNRQRLGEATKWFSSRIEQSGIDQWSRRCLPLTASMFPTLAQASFLPPVGAPSASD
jgi:hypothetical protein